MLKTGSMLERPISVRQTTSMLDYLYFADSEFNASGDAFVGYWKYSQKLEFAKFTSGALDIVTFTRYISCKQC